VKQVPRRKVDVRKQIIKTLIENKKLTWTELLEKTKISKASLSKYLSQLEEEIMERVVDSSTKPPTVYYRLKKDETLGRLPTDTKISVLNGKTDFSQRVEKELKILREKGIVELDDPKEGIEKMYDFWFQDFLFTLYWASKAPTALEALSLLEWHITLYRKTMLQMTIRCIRNSEWKATLEEVWKEYYDIIEVLKKKYAKPSTLH
jgi:DNA-binding transcriptional ArsR family regulator